MKNSPTAESSRNLENTGSGIMQTFRSLGAKGKMLIATTSAAASMAVGGCTDSNGYLSGSAYSAGNGSGTVTGSADGSSSNDSGSGSDAGSTVDSGSTSSAVDAAGSTSLDNGTSSFTDTADSTATVDSTVTVDSTTTADIPTVDISTMVGYDSTGIDTATIDTIDTVDTTNSSSNDTGVSVDTTPAPVAKFWNTHPDAPADESLMGCKGGELPVEQRVVTNSSYQIAALDPNKTKITDMASQVIINQNGDQVFKIPFSAYPQNKDGQNYRIVGMGLQNPNAKVGTYVISQKVGGLDRMPLLPIVSKNSMGVQELMWAVKNALGNDSFATVSDIRDALTATLAATDYDVQPVTPGKPGTVDGQTTTAKKEAIVWIYPMPDAKCTEVIQK